MHNTTITYRQQYSFCSKPGCRKCREGNGHGPYWYAYQTVQGRTVRTYIGKLLPAGVPADQLATLANIPYPDQASTALPAFRLTTLGTLRLEGRGEDESWQDLNSTNWRLPQARSLLGCLLCAPRRQLTQQQAGALIWPDLEKKSAAQQVRRAGTALSQLLGPIYSKQANAVLTLAGQTHFWADSTAFEDLLAQAHTRPANQRTELLEQAIKLYSGDFFADERSASWPVQYRQHLHRLWDAAMLELIDLYLDARRFTLADNLLHRLLTTNAASEPAVQRLMFLLASQQRRAEAVQAYQRLVSLLQTTRQSAPAPATDALVHAIQQGLQPLPRPGAAAADGQEGPWTEDTSPGKDAQRSPAGRGSAVISFVRANQSPLVGRDAEMQFLVQQLAGVESIRTRQASTTDEPVISQETQRTPQVHCLLLLGEAGIGKTRLAEETARVAGQRGWSVIWSRTYTQERGIPYRLWTAALRSVLTHTPDLVHQAAEFAPPGIYQPLRALVPEIQETLLTDGSPQENATPFPDGLLPEQEELRLREAVYGFLTTLSFTAPLLIVLDDIQWADDSSVQLLGYLIRRITDHPLTILATARETELTTHHALSDLVAHTQREQVIELLHVQPLSDEQIGTLVSYLPITAITRIQSQAAGNPFFAEELAYSLQTSAADAFSPSASKPVQVLPDTIAAALNQRLNRLSKTCRDLLDKAAVLGGSFDFRLIAATENASASLDDETVLDLLDEALEAGVLTEEGKSTHVTYHFWHPLLASHLYNELSATRRARFHRRIADVLLQIYQGHEIEEAATITEHLTRGGAEAGRISHYAELAAHHAYSLFAYSTAERYYRRVLDHLAPILLAPVYNEENERLLLAGFSLEQRLHLAFLIERLADCTRVLGNFQDAPNFYRRAILLRTMPPRVFANETEERQEAQIQAILWSEIAVVQRFLGDATAAHASNQEGVAVLRAAGITDGPAWGFLLYQQANLYLHEGLHQQALQTLHRALDLFTAGLAQVSASPKQPTMYQTRTMLTLRGDPVDLGRVHAFLGIAYLNIGQLDEALTHLQEALTIYQRHARLREVGHVYCNIGHVYLLKAEYTQARSFFEKPLSYVEQSGDIPLKSVLLYNMGEVAIAARRFDEAERCYREALELAEQINDRDYLSSWHAILGVLLLKQERFKEAARAILHALAIGRAVPRNQSCIDFALITLAQLRCALVECEHSTDTPAGRRALLHARADLQRALAHGDLDAERRTLARLEQAHVSHLLGDLSLARSQCQAVAQDAQHYGLTALLLRSQQLQTQLHGT